MQNICTSKTTATEVTLLMGSNLPFGKLASNDILLAAARILEMEIGAIVRKTAIGKSAAWGFSGSEFCNQILVCTTTLAPLAVLDICEEVERRFGREAKGYDWRAERAYADRKLDIDILYFGDLTLCDARLEVPHPKIAERPFVLELLSEMKRV